ncbi:unnamed protein product [Amoebophrya sp. A25]|nr:unnamed protein product [Amoebophrya sp. A25]|eukprot:GSA25T00009024001.1
MSLIIRSGLLRPSLQSKLRIAFTLLSAPLFGVEGLGQQKEEQIIGDWYGVPNEVATGSPSNAFLEVKDTYLEELVIDIFNELNTKLEEGELSSENVSEVIQRQCARYDWEQLRKEAAQLTKPQSLPYGGTMPMHTARQGTRCMVVTRLQLPHKVQALREPPSLEVLHLSAAHPRRASPSRLRPMLLQLNSLERGPPL